MAVLVAYFSRNGENYFPQGVMSVEEGNTSKLAKIIAEKTGGNLFEIKTKVPYDHNYRGCTSKAKEEFYSNARPELQDYLSNVDEYDTIYLGFPIWWGTMPKAVLSFVESLELSGKRVKPFITHEGSGVGESMRDLHRALPHAIISDGLCVFGHQVDFAHDDVDAWLAEKDEAAA